MCYGVCMAFLCKYGLIRIRTCAHRATAIAIVRLLLHRELYSWFHAFQVLGHVLGENCTCANVIHIVLVEAEWKMKCS